MQSDIHSDGALPLGRARAVEPPIVRALRWGTASVWLFHGLFSKVLSGIPRHQQIVARVVGQDLSRAATLLVGAIEICIAGWVVSRRAPRACAATQTALLASMNALEIVLARDLLRAPVAMVCANVVFLTFGWILALHPSQGA